MLHFSVRRNLIKVRLNLNQRMAAPWHAVEATYSTD